MRVFFFFFFFEFSKSEYRTHIKDIRREILVKEKKIDFFARENIIRSDVLLSDVALRDRAG